MSSELFIPIKFNSSIQLLPIELNANINDTILTKLKKKLENSCSKHGYIKKNSIKIIKKSIGQFKKQHFNGNIVFDLQCIAEICNPAKGSIISCKIKAKNSLGLLASGYYDDIPILEIIIPKISAGIKSEINIDEVNIGDEINIEVCGKKYMLYDKYISIIGKAIKDKMKNIINEDFNGIENELEDTNIIDDNLDIINIDDEGENDDEENDDEENDEDDDDEEEDDDKDKEEEEEDEEEEEIEDLDDEELEDVLEDDLE